MNSLSPTSNFIKELNEIKIQNSDILQRALCSIKICSNLLSFYKKKILVKKFQTIQEEIEFFKKTKQIPLIQLIYFSEIRSFEIQFPKADKSEQLKFIKKKISQLNQFFLFNLDFGRYVDSGATHFDKEYYTREYLGKCHITTSNFYFQDPDFCTPRDMLLGKYKAYDSLVTYLDKKKYIIKNNLNETHAIIKAKIHWPFNNTNYVELLYALYVKGLGRENNMTIIKVSEHLQQVFDITPKDIYKTYQDIKNRKNSRTLFLDELSTGIISEMNKSEE
ncbi:RteC domain-containing protein [Polaribacter sp. Q13]|uniref:RteC domain-containing protein n=1 Tax=Polaribacter sp. Q13 TaxID=2806551 RepID=UPI00193B6E62|nr:RteC domain-containing protein [Polaribacter sp. Q13]QVY66865.1 RteC domain-containing protein [Polaribacter sp. Q13]